MPRFEHQPSLAIILTTKFPFSGSSVRCRAAEAAARGKSRRNRFGNSFSLSFGVASEIDKISSAFYDSTSLIKKSPPERGFFELLVRSPIITGRPTLPMTLLALELVKTARVGIKRKLGDFCTALRAGPVTLEHLTLWSGAKAAATIIVSHFTYLILYE